MDTKKKVKADTLTDLEDVFTKEQLVSSKRFDHVKDILEAVLLDAEQLYSIDSVESLINNFMKGKVK